MDSKREEEGGRMQCFMINEDKSLIDVDKFESRRNCFHLN